jgi:polar amino acid transport system substrate-binding protein
MFSSLYHRRRFIVALAVLLPLFSLLPGSAHAQPSPAPTETLKVAIKPLEPFVVKREDGSYAGYSIDLWQEVARRNGWSTEFVWTETVTELLKQVENGNVDAGIAGISMTWSTSRIQCSTAGCR